MPHIAQADSIDTALLRLRPMKIEDAASVHRLWTERAMLRWLWEADDVAPEQSAAVIERSVESFEKRGAGLWCAYPREEDVLVGFVGFWFMPYSPDPELILGVGSTYAHRGFGRQMIEAIVWHGLHALEFVRIVADIRNARAAALFERVGFRFDRTLLIEGYDELAEGYQANFYAVDASTFRAAGEPPRVLRGPQPLV